MQICWILDIYIFDWCTFKKVCRARKLCIIYIYETLTFGIELLFLCFKAHNENERSWWGCECTAYGLMHDKSKIHAPKRQHKTRKISQFKCIATILRRISYYYFLYGDNESHMSLSPSRSFLFFLSLNLSADIIESVRFEHRTRI